MKDGNEADVWLKGCVKERAGGLMKTDPLFLTVV